MIELPPFFYDTIVDLTHILEHSTGNDFIYLLSTQVDSVLV